MKRIAIFLFLFFIFFVNSRTQTIFYDAVKFKDALDKKNTKKITEILGKYTNEGKQTYFTNVKNEFSANPYIGSLLNLDTALANIDIKVTKQKLILKNFFDIESNLDNIEVTGDFARLNHLMGNANFTENLTYLAYTEPTIVSSESVSSNPGIGYLAVDALAKLFIKRAKEYLSSLFIGKLKEFLATPPISDLFIESARFVNSFDFEKENINYISTLKFIQEAFQRDLDNLFANSTALLKDESEMKKILTDPSIYAKYISIKGSKEMSYLFLAANILDDLKKEKHPSEIISDICQDNIIKSDTTLNKTFGLISEISLSLLDSAGSKNNWIDFKQFSDFFNNADNRKIFYGLLYQKFITDSKLKGIMYGSRTFSQILSDIQSNTTILDGYVMGFLDKANVIQNIVISLKNKKREGIKLEPKDYVNYIGEVFNLLNLAQNYKYISNGNDILLLSEFSKINKVYNDILPWYDQIVSKNYSSAIVSAIILFNELGLKEFIKVDDEFFKYSSFLTSIANATTSEEIDDAIESVALPPGSFTLKRKVAMNVGLNGYLGYFTGMGITGTDKVIKGMTAPLGLEMSFGTGDFSAGLFLPIIDIAASVSYRLENDTAQTRNDFSWNDIMAPGAFIMFGITKEIPISFGAGVQFGPILQKFDNETSKKRIFRWSVFLALDIPLFNFYTKPKE